MGRSPQPRKGAKEPVLAPRKKTQTGTEAGGGGADGSHRPCWTFNLIAVTDAGRKAQPHTRVNGRTSGSQVTVFANGLSLGSAPASASAQMIEAIRQKGGRLTGEILSVGKTGSSVTVQLCLS